MQPWFPECQVEKAAKEQWEDVRCNAAALLQPLSHMEIMANTQAGTGWVWCDPKRLSPITTKNSLHHNNNDKPPTTTKNKPKIKRRKVEHNFPKIKMTVYASYLTKEKKTTKCQK